MRVACALAGALVRAAVLAKAPRRTTAAVAAAAYAAAQRGLCPDSDWRTTAAGVGPPGTTPGGDAAALRAARAAARKRRKAAARARKQKHMEIDDGDAERAAPTGDRGPSGSSLALEPRRDPLPALAADVLPPQASSKPTLPSSSSGAVPAATRQEDMTGIEEVPGFHLGTHVIVGYGEFAGASGCIASLESGYALIDVHDGAVFHECSPIVVPVADLVLQRSKQPGRAHPGRLRGRRRR